MASIKQGFKKLAKMKHALEDTYDKLFIHYPYLGYIDGSRAGFPDEQRVVKKDGEILIFEGHATPHAIEKGLVFIAQKMGGSHSEFGQVSEYYTVSKGRKDLGRMTLAQLDETRKLILIRDNTTSIARINGYDLLTYTNVSPTPPSIKTTSDTKAPGSELQSTSVLFTTPVIGQWQRINMLRDPSRSLVQKFCTLALDSSPYARQM